MDREIRQQMARSIVVVEDLDAQEPEHRLRAAARLPRSRGCRWKSRDGSDNWRSPPGNRRPTNGSSLGGSRQECAELVQTGARILKDDRCLNAYEI